jgi:rSAM/selenodomain-associated transferase 1
MAKYPAPGRVKTRLANALGADVACALYRAFVLDLWDRLRGLPYPVTWAYWPPEAPFGALLPDARCRAQTGADLGERMAAAIASELCEHGGPVLVIGADVPHVAAASLAEGAAALAGGADVVLGPAADGGYYLIGVKAAVPALFERIAWGTPEVLGATLARAAELRLVTHRLSPDFDVDEPADLDSLRTLLARGQAQLPRTARLLGDGSSSRLA